MRLFCFHQWDRKTYRHIYVHDHGVDLPKRVDTEFSLICRKCEMPRVKRIRGAWGRGNPS